jgi:hypothetical protein
MADASHEIAATGVPPVEMRRIEKHFPGVHALRGVNFDLRAGEVHALMKVLTGVNQPDSGEILIDGKLSPHGHRAVLQSVSRSPPRRILHQPRSKKASDSRVRRPRPKAALACEEGAVSTPAG